MESLETWAVSLKLAIIAGLVTGLAVHFGQEARADTLVHPPIQATGWAAITLALGMVITVQGFETSLSFLRNRRLSAFFQDPGNFTGSSTM